MELGNEGTFGEDDNVGEFVTIGELLIITWCHETCQLVTIGKFIIALSPFKVVKPGAIGGVNHLRVEGCKLPSFSFQISKS